MNKQKQYTRSNPSPMTATGIQRLTASTQSSREQAHVLSSTLFEFQIIELSGN